jgi:hypothetical protein
LLKISPIDASANLSESCFGLWSEGRLFVKNVVDFLRLANESLCVEIRILFHDLGVGVGCRDLLKIALTVPSGNPVLFAILRAPIPFSWCRARTVRIVASGTGGLPSFFPLARTTLSPAIVRSDILARSCFAKVANIEIITSLNGPVESSHCS